MYDALHLHLRRFAALAIIIALPAFDRAVEASDTEARDRLVAMMHGRLGAASRVELYSSLDELLPNVQFRVAGRGVRRAATRVVVGRVLTVEPGMAFAPSNDDGSTSEAMPFDDPRALWRTMHITLEVEEDLGKPGNPDRTVRVGFAIDASQHYPSLLEGLESLGRSVWFLKTDSPVFKYDRKLLSVVEDGGLIATIAADGTVDLPLLESDRARELLGSIATLDDLKARATGGPREIRVRRKHGLFEREATQPDSGT